MNREISVREWQQKYAAGEFAAPDYSTQCRAGWYDWFCKDSSLAGRLKKLSGIVMGIKDPFILDNYYVWFKNNCPVSGPLYDDVRFDPLHGERNGRYFMVAVSSPHEVHRYSLFTERGGFEIPEYETDERKELINYINDLGPQLAKLESPEEETADLEDFETDGSEEAGQAREMGGMEL